MAAIRKVLGIDICARKVERSCFSVKILKFFVNFAKASQKDCISIWLPFKMAACPN